MTYAKLTDSGTIAYPPATIVRPDGTTVIGYNRNESLLQADGWMQVIEDERPAEPALPRYSIEDGHIRVSWELLPPQSPPVPVLIEGGIETPVLVLKSQVVGKGIGVIATDDGDLTTYIDHESPRPADEIIEARKATAVAAKKAAKNTAKAAAKKGKLQERIAAIEAFLGIA
jgi:hypothetical protein